jgi:hypothetical protein
VCGCMRPGPALQAGTFQRLRHGGGGVDALDAAVGAAAGQLHQMVDPVLMLQRVDEVSHADLAA